MSNTPFVKTTGPVSEGRSWARASRVVSLRSKVADMGKSEKERNGEAAAVTIHVMQTARQAYACRAVLSHVTCHLAPCVNSHNPGPSGRLFSRLLIGLQTRDHFLAIAVQFLRRIEGAFEQNGQVVQDAFDDLLFPAVVEADLFVEPALE